MEEEASSDQFTVVREESVQGANIGLLVLAAATVAHGGSTASGAAVSKEGTTP